MEFAGQCVVGVVVKARVLPECVELGRHGGLAWASATERRQMLVADVERGQGLRQGLAVVLRIGARARNGAHVRDQFDLGALQQRYKFLEAPGRMSDREIWIQCASRYF